MQPQPGFSDLAISSYIGAADHALRSERSGLRRHNHRRIGDAPRYGPSFGMVSNIHYTRIQAMVVAPIRLRERAGCNVPAVTDAEGKRE
jgi:hypothetical protein